MKKIIGLLLVSMSVFFNIDEASGADLGIYNGVCELNTQSDNMCVYNCNVTEEKNYMNFSYVINYDKNSTKDPLTHSIESVSVDGSCDLFMNKDCSGIPVTHNLKDNPPDNFFIIKGDLKCRTVVFDIDIESTTMMGTGNHIMNHISIYEGPNSYDPSLDNPHEGVTDNSICGLLGGENSKVVKIIKQIYDYIKVLIPILIVAFSIVDFIKVITSGKDDDMKKAINSFIKRVILAVIFVVVPFLIKLIINVSGVSSQISGLNDGINSIFCILG